MNEALICQVEARLADLQRQAEAPWHGVPVVICGRVCTSRPYLRDVLLPSWRRRAGRHLPFLWGEAYGECKLCGQPQPGDDAPEDWPCPDFRDLCDEVGIDVVDEQQQGGAT